MGVIDVDLVVREVIESSRRYRHLARSVIERMAGEEAPKSRNLAEAVKRTKRRLHQVFGAYATPLPYEKLLQRLGATASEPGAFKDACREVLALHASSAERLPELDGFYQTIFGITGRPGRVLDLACGFNPLTIPWMNLAAGASYVAADIDLEMVDFLDRYLKLAAVNGSAMVNDLVAGPPDVEADVAFLFKTLPCLQHQVSDLGGIIERIRAKWVVCTFPTRSLGNRAKGMVENYRAFFEKIVDGRHWRSKEVVLRSELIFLIER